MNERIKQLAEQAWTVVSDEERTRGELYEADTQRERRDQVFAELIVAECMEVCRRGKYDGRDDMSLIQFNNGIRFCMNAIDNHFGD